MTRRSPVSAVRMAVAMEAWYASAPWITWSAAIETMIASGSSAAISSAARPSALAVPRAVGSTMNRASGSCSLIIATWRSSVRTKTPSTSGAIRS